MVRGCRGRDRGRCEWGGRWRWGYRGWFVFGTHGEPASCTPQEDVMVVKSEIDDLHR
jgi:hypothetical protein